MTLRLSHLDRCFPEAWRGVGVNPHTGYIQRVRQELLELGVLEEGERGFQGFCGVPRYFHPRAGEEALVLSLELICWFFYFDDPFDDGEVGLEGQSSGEALVERMVGVLKTGELPPQPQGTERLCQRFRERARRMCVGREGLWLRFLGLCGDWVGSILPTHRRGHPRLPTLREYDALRLTNVGILPEFALNEILLGASLSPAFIERREVARLRELAALVIAYCNDIYSYEREVQRGTQLNSLELRQLHGGLRLEQAYSEQLTDIRTWVEEFLALETALTGQGLLGEPPPGEDSARAHTLRAQTRYVWDIKALIMGNHTWSLADGRYHSRTSPFDELRLGAPDAPGQGHASPRP